jgi:hypothetical protein
MRKTLLLLLVILAWVMTSRIVSGQLSGCLNGYPHTATYCVIEAASSDPYDCYDYVRAAIEGHYVILASGLPKPGHPAFYNFNGGGEINSDNKYVIVSGNNYLYDVASFTSHAVLKLTSFQSGGQPFYASKDGRNGHLYMQTTPDAYGVGGTPDYLVYVGTITSSTTSLIPGGQVTYSVLNTYNNLIFAWSFDSNYFDYASGSNANSNPITLVAKCPSGSYGPHQQTVRVTVSSSCPTCGSGKTQLNQAVTINCPVIDPCQGTYQINGTGTVYPLNTVNSVSGSPVIATLNGGTGVIYTWTLISGSPSSWYYYGTGNKILSVALNKNSSASFRLTSSTCNRSITFSRGASLMASKSLNTLTDSINAVLDTLFIPYDVANESVKTPSLDANVNNGVYVNQPRKTLVINDNIGGERVFKIISIQGILKKNGKIYGGRTEIDIQDLPSGIYIITLADCSYRFIKQ